MINLSQYLTYIHIDQFKLINKTPVWIDKAILKTLSLHSQTDILSWISDSNKNIIDFLKKICNKYKYWIDMGQELHLLK
jgi:hypothetical protein